MFMEITGLRGTKLQGTEITKIEKQDLQAVILDVKREQKDLYEFVQIETSRGRVDCAYYRAEGTDKGVIMVTGVTGGFDSPADSLYPRLSADLKEIGISSLAGLSYLNIYTGLSLHFRLIWRVYLLFGIDQ